MTTIVWIGIALCIIQSAIFSGLNLAFFTVTKLRLEIEAAKNNKHACRVLALRQDSNFLLVTILWGNVSVNVLLALLSNSLLTGVAAFLFSTVLITLVGEIMPQAYFSRNALKMASLLTPVIRFYQILLFPMAKPTAFILDKWLGTEAITYFKEKDFRKLISMHVYSSETDIDPVEGRGALNFLAIDDLPVTAEGETINPKSIVKMEFKNERPVFPNITPSGSDKFLKLINDSGKKWIIIVDSNGEPRMTLNSDSFLRDALFNYSGFNPYLHCHRPIIVRNKQTRLGEIIPSFKVHPERRDDDVIDEDIILFWDEEKRVITGSDILGRLLRGIVYNEAIGIGKTDFKGLA
jgi:metal transporter CNNM